MLKRSVWVLILGWGVLFAFPSGDVRLLSDTESGCEFLVSVDGWTNTPIGEGYHRIDFPRATFSGDPGTPQIPSRVVVVALPPAGGARVEVQTGSLETVEGIRIPPFPTITRSDDFPVEVFEEGEPYRRTGFYPGVFYEASEPEICGAYRVIRIVLYPFQFDPTHNRVVYPLTLLVRVVFEKPARGEIRPSPPTVHEPAFREVVLNYDRARSWRIPSPPLKSFKPTFGPGSWFALSVTQEGIYRVTGAFLKSQGISLSQLDPKTLKVYNNGGRMLPRPIQTPRPSSLLELPILVFDGEDGSFDESDYFLFYGKGVTGWEYAPTRGFSHYGNLYTNTNTYWITFNDGVPGKRVDSRSVVPEGEESLVTRFWDRLFYEQDIINPQNGGVIWLGPVLNRDMPTRSFSVTLPDLADPDSVWVRFRVWGLRSLGNRWTLSFNGIGQGSWTVGGSFQEIQAAIRGVARAGDNTLALSYSGTDALAEAYLDWYEVFFLRHLRMTGNRFFFTSPSSPGLYRFRIQNFPDQALVWDVTDPAETKRLEVSASDGVGEFVDRVLDQPKTYVVVTPSGYLTPSDLVAKRPADLRNPENGADLVIITHADFYPEAERLKAHKESTQGLSVYLTDIQDVFDGFAWGLYDPTAIRDFLAYAWEHWRKRPSYLLLMGDGDYDYRNILGKADRNWIPPYEEEGYGEAGSRATDDWYVMVAGDDRLPDLAVGRLPVKSREEARWVVDKIIRYEAQPERGLWRNRITLVADDEMTDRPQAEYNHMEATLQLANTVIPASYDLQPVYLIHYPAEIVYDRRRKPKAQAELIRRINEGTVYVNYIGHANEDLWAHEWVFVREEDLQKLKNGSRWPVFYAATCSFARYDHYKKSSFGEDLVVGIDAGAIGLIGSSRDCSATQNEDLNRRFVRLLFPDRPGGVRLGDALLGAKLSARNGANDEMYHLLGDPTMRIGTPWHRGRFVEIAPDTLRALHLQRVEGEILRAETFWSDFSGRVLLQAQDARRVYSYGTSGFGRTYWLPGNALFRGQSRVEAGRFSAAFIVPKDIGYGETTGRLGAYFYNEETDGSLTRDGLPLGGSGLIEDTQGPDIFLYFEGYESFFSGGSVSENPVLVARIVDDRTGINLTGDIGHTIQLFLDDHPPIDLTDLFQYDEGSYLAGRLSYPLTGLATGPHQVKLKVWDNANNSSLQSLAFIVVPVGDLVIEEVLNYPNPMDRETHFTFRINREAQVEIEIFTVSGRKIRQIERQWVQPGFNMIPWDGRDGRGDPVANGVYFYRITARAQHRNKTVTRSEIGRLMVIRP